MAIVKDVFESLGAPARAVSWGAQYGDNLRLAWDECEHPELLLPMARGVGVPDWDILNASIEVLRAHFTTVHLHIAAEAGLRSLERYICDLASDEVIEKVIAEMVLLTNELDERFVSQRSGYGAVGKLCEASLDAKDGMVHGMLERISVAIMLAAQARAYAIAWDSSEGHREKLIDEGLRGTAHIARRYIPFEAFVAGFVTHLNAEHGYGYEMPVA